MRNRNAKLGLPLKTRGSDGPASDAASGAIRSIMQPSPVTA